MDEPLRSSFPSPVTSPRAGVLWVVVGVVVLLMAAIAGLRGAERGDGFEGASHVLLVSIPGLRWQDLEATRTPALDALLGSSALLSTRAGGMELNLLEGYLTFNSGNTMEPGSLTAGAPDTSSDATTCSPELAAAAAGGIDSLTDAEVGALGAALRDAGVERRVFGGSVAVAALMDDAGCVDVHRPLEDAMVGPGVTLVELPGLEVTDDPLDRRRILESHEELLRSLAPPDDSLVVVMAPVGPSAMADVTVVAIRDAGAIRAREAFLTSATTRRSGYVRTSDLAPTVLAALGIDIPTSMAGTPAVSSSQATPLDARIAEHAELSERVLFRDSTIWPVSAAVVVATSVCGVAAAARRFRVARLAGCTALALVSWSFLSGLVAYHHVGRLVYVVALVAVSAATAGLSLLASRRWRRSPVDILGALLWVLMILDVVLGGRLQINTPLGYSPTVAGRFQGIGNLAFAIVAIAALVTAVIPAHDAEWSGRHQGRWFLMWVGALSSIVVAAPRFGSDVGGTLALVPAFVLAGALLAGRTAPWRRLAVAGVATGVGVMLLGLLDRSRPTNEQTHLGRFVDRLLAGQAGPILRRKLRSNLDLFTASVWPMLLLVLLVVLAVLLWSRRDRVRDALRGRDAERAFLGGFGAVAVLGFLLNDSGIAVPAMMIAVGVPWIVVTVVQPHLEGPT